MPTPKKPTVLHILNGNPSKIKDLGKYEPKPEPIAPKRPSWLTGEGKKMWVYLAPQLEKLGLLTKIYGQAFAAGCQEWGTYVYCQKYLKKHGLTYEYTNTKGSVNEIERPEVKIGQKAYAQFMSFCREFGLTPASMSKISIMTEDTNDVMESLLSGVK